MNDWFLLVCFSGVMEHSTNVKSTVYAEMNAVCGWE